MRLTNHSGSGSCFSEGVVTYSNEAKINWLGVPAEIIATQGAVSAPCAEAMAAGMLERSGADHAISITGIAGPLGGSDDKPVGTVFLGYAGPTGVKSMKIFLPGDRDLIRWRSSQAALDYLRHQLMKTNLASARH